MDGFAEVLWRDGGGSVEVGDGAGNFEDAIVSAGGEAETRDGVFEKFFAFGGNGAVFANEPRGHLGVGVGLFFLLKSVRIGGCARR